MLSRVAERIYWLARYFERAENTARLINVQSHLLLDLPKDVFIGWDQLITITGAEDIFSDNYDTVSERNVMKFLIADTQNPTSIMSSLHAGRENARTIRDILPKEAWLKANDLFLTAKSQVGALSRRRRHDFLDHVINDIQSLTGLLAGTMLHDNGYDILRLGRNLERADMTTRIVDVRSANLIPEKEDLLPFETIQWVSVLNSLSGYQAYRQKVQGPVRREGVLNFLLREKDFPRSYSHCVGEVIHCLRCLPRGRKIVEFADNAMEKVSDRKMKKLASADLHKYIDDLQIVLAELHSRINEQYFEVKR